MFPCKIYAINTLSDSVYQKNEKRPSKLEKKLIRIFKMINYVSICFT